MMLLEFTVPWESVNNFKRRRCCGMRVCGGHPRLKLHHFTTLHLRLETGCRGIIKKRNHLVLETLCNLIKIRGRKQIWGSLG